jgi:hypothetical protein
MAVLYYPHSIVPLYTVLYHLYGQSILKMCHFHTSCEKLRSVTIGYDKFQMVTLSIIDSGCDKLRSSIIALYSVYIPYYIIELLYYDLYSSFILLSLLQF